MHTGKCTTCRQFKQRSQAIEKLQQSLCRPNLPSLAAFLRCNMSLLALFRQSWRVAILVVIGRGTDIGKIGQNDVRDP